MSKSVDSGKDETVYVYVGEDPEDTVTITALLNPEVDAETLPEGCPAWQNAEPLEENPLKAEFLIDTPSDSVGDEANIVRVTCGDSEVALKIIVVKIDLVFEGLPEAPEDPPTEEDPPNEEEPGGFIMVNCNDNAGGENPGEGNGVMDINDDTPLQNPDPDLKPVTLMLLPDDLAQGKVTLDVPGILMVWEDAEKNEPPGKVDDLLLEWEDPSEMPTSLYLEGYSPGVGNLTLTYEGKITCSDTVKMTAVRVEIKKPSGDPANPDEANEWNERSYDTASSGVVTVVCEAEETPFSDKLRWTIDSVGEITATWDPHVDGNPNTGKGLNSTATFTGLPANNSSFGPKTITLTMDKEGVNGSDTQTVEIFFHPTAKNHPGTPVDVPNWFYYWQKIDDLGNQNAVYDSTLTNPGETSTPLHGGGFGFYWITWSPSNFKVGNAAYQLSLSLGRYRNSQKITTPGIDTFYVTTQHEEVHLSMFGSGVGKRDDDQDGIANTLETETDPTREATHKDNMEYIDDVQNFDSEYYSYKHEETLELGIFNNQDWSSGSIGRQWRK